MTNMQKYGTATQAIDAHCKFDK